MSNLLYNSHPLVIDPDLAKLIGLNEAIILQQIHYWIEINKRTDKNYRNGHYWTYNSYEQWREQFPFWSINTIRRVIKNLKDIKLIISNNFNHLSIDRTKWYRIDYEVLDILESSPFAQIGQSNISNWLDHLSKVI